MRIDGSGRIIDARPFGAPARSPGAASRFSLGSAEGAPEAAASRAAPALSGLEAMLALQAVEDPLGRRRKAMRRGRGLLDLLDELRIALLGGAVSTADASRLSALLHDARESVDDPVLEGVLSEIDLRAAVELAKLERRPA